MISPMMDEMGASTGGRRALGQAERHELELLVDDLAGAEDVGAPVELHPDDADALEVEERTRRTPVAPLTASRWGR
jgi:hypothetical protein